MNYRFNHHSPARFFEYFEEISNIPRRSGDEAAISDYLMAFAQKHGYACERDAALNVKMTIPATPGYEDRKVIALQAHTDMVCVADPGVDHDFSSDPIHILEEDGFLKGDGTSLGSDDGSGVALILAFLDLGYPHGKMQALFTTGEEIGLIGAKQLSPAWFDCDYLVGLDCSSSKRIIVSAAGMSLVEFTIPAAKIPAGADGTKALIHVKIHEMKGGHSGNKIHCDLGNAIKVGGELAEAVLRTSCVQLSDIQCANPFNAIPAQADLCFVCAKAQQEAVLTSITAAAEEIRKAYWHTEPDMQIDVSEITYAEEAVALSSEDTDRLLSFLSLLYTGAYVIADETFSRADCSSNPASISHADGAFHLLCSNRSNSEYFHNKLLQLHMRTASLHGIDAKVLDRYSSWQYKPSSAFRDRVVELFSEVKGEVPAAAQIHAGLEEGIFEDKAKLNGNDHIDMITLGCMTYDVHSTRERLEIASVEPVFDLIVRIMQEKFD